MSSSLALIPESSKVSDGGNQSEPSIDLSRSALIRAFSNSSRGVENTRRRRHQKFEVIY